MAYNVPAQPNTNPIFPYGGTLGGSTSTTQGTSSSVSTPEQQQSSELALNQQIAAAAAQLGATQYQWGLNQYANTSNVTDNSIENYLNASQQDMGLAGQTLQQYEQVGAPAINQLGQEAAQYTSPSRIGINMGAAESQSAQGTNAALAAAKQNLQSYGINPNSGEYQELVSANKTAGGAAAAGAGQQAELATEATGRGLLSNLIATTQQMPGQAINASNAGVGAVTGAENAALANANTGATLTGSANPYLSTGISGKLPPVANASTSTSQSSGNSNSFNIGQSYPPGGSSQSVGMTQNNMSNYGGYNSGFAAAGGSIGDFAGGGAPGFNPITPEEFATLPDSGSYTGGTPVKEYYKDKTAHSFGDQTTGGFVPRQASPSGGVNVDDVPANLNAEEFVIPRDVARWKGEEFWHKEIAKSRAARAKAQQDVGPTMGPPQAAGQQPSFNSQSAAHGGAIEARHDLRDLKLDEFLNRRHMYGGGGI